MRRILPIIMLFFCAAQARWIKTDSVLARTPPLYIGSGLTVGNGLFSCESLLAVKISTGHGFNELFKMNQDVQKTDTVIFGGLVVDEDGERNDPMFGMVQIGDGDFYGGSVSTNADELVIINTSTTPGLSFLSPNNASGVIYFADDGDDNVGALQYNHVSEQMIFRVGDNDRFTIDSDGDGVFDGNVTADTFFGVISSASDSSWEKVDIDTVYGLNGSTVMFNDTLILLNHAISMWAGGTEYARLRLNTASSNKVTLDFLNGVTQMDLNGKLQISSWLSSPTVYVSSSIIEQSGAGGGLLKTTGDFWIANDQKGFQLGNASVKWELQNSGSGDSLRILSAGGLQASMTQGGLFTAKDIAVYDGSSDPTITITAAHDTDYDGQIQFKAGATPANVAVIGVPDTTGDFKIVPGSGTINDVNAIQFSSATEEIGIVAPLYNVGSYGIHFQDGGDNTNDVMQIAYNRSIGNNTKDATEYSFYDGWESNFDNGSQEVVERYFRVRKPADPGPDTLYQPFGTYFDRLTNRTVVTQFSGDVMSFLDGAASGDEDTYIKLQNTGIYLYHTGLDADITAFGSSVVLSSLKNPSNWNFNAVIGAANVANGINYNFFKTRSTGSDANTTLIDDDVVAVLNFYGADGSRYNAAAAIQVEVDGNPSSGNHTPGAIAWKLGVTGSQHGTEKMRLTNNGNLDVTGAYSSATTTVTATGPTDNLDVESVNTIFIDTGSNNVTIGGFTNGVDGQIIHIAVTDISNNVTLEHAEGTGNQDLYLHSGGDETLTTEYGGWVLVCNGTHWYDTSN